MKNKNICILIVLLVTSIILPFIKIDFNNDIPKTDINNEINEQTGEDIDHAIEIYNTFTDIRRFQPTTYYKVWSSSGKYLSIEVNHGFQPYVNILNHTPYTGTYYVENTTEGYYYFTVSPYLYMYYSECEFGFQNYTINVHKNEVYTHKSAVEIIEGNTVVNFTDDYHYKKYYKIYVEKNKNLIIYNSEYSFNYYTIKDENFSTCYSEIIQNGIQIQNTSYSGYYYIIIDRSYLNSYLGLSSDLSFNFKVIIENSISMENALELSEGTNNIQMGNYITKYCKVQVEKNRMLWIRQIHNLSMIQLMNLSSGGPLGLWVNENTSKSGYYYFRVDKYNNTIKSIEIEIIIESVNTVRNATEIVAGTHDDLILPEGNYPYKYYKIYVDSGKYLGFFINMSPSFIWSMFSGGYFSDLNIIEYVPSSGFYYIWIGLINQYSKPVYAYQLNVTIKDSYTWLNASEVETGKTNISLAKNSYPYAYYKINIPKNKFFSVKINNPLFGLSIYDENGTILSFPYDPEYLFKYIDYSTKIGQTYYIRIGTKSFSLYGGNPISYVAPNIFYDKCELEIIIADDISLDHAETISIGDSIATNLDPYGIKKYRTYLLEGKYFKIKTNHPSTTGYCTISFSDTAGMIKSYTSSHLYPLTNVYYIQKSGYYNITIQGSGFVDLCMELLDTLPDPEYTMPIQKDSWASYDLQIQLPEELFYWEELMMMMSMSPYYPSFNILNEQINLVITDVDQYRGNYIFNDNYIPSYYYPLMLSMPLPFIPTNFDPNLMGNIPMVMMAGYYFNLEIFNDGAIDGVYTDGTYTLNGKIFNTIVYSVKIDSITYMNFNYEKNTGLLLSAEIPNVVLKDFGEFSYSIELVDTDILDLTTTSSPIPAFNFGFIILAILSISIIFIIQIKVKEQQFFKHNS